MPVKDLERVIYYDAIHSHPARSLTLSQQNILSSAEYEKYLESGTIDTEFKADTGAGAVKALLELIDLRAEVNALEVEYAKRLRLLRA